MMDRIKVLKTYKIFINGKFPRTESGRYYKIKNNNIDIANVCRSSRKDIKNAVLAARNAVSGWSNKTAYNRSQVLYRIAEMLEGRKNQFVDELNLLGISKKSANVEVDKSIDRIIYFAGWSDKINQVFGAVNPVSTSHFNFTLLEPMGVVAIIAPENYPLLGLISSIIPIIVSGNSVIVIASEIAPLPAISLSEVIANSDVPNGVINILTGKKEELSNHIYSHMDINAVADFSKDMVNRNDKVSGIDNLKRITHFENLIFESDEIESPYIIKKFMEVKTTWHPIELGFTSSNNY